MSLCVCVCVCSRRRAGERAGWYDTQATCARQTVKSQRTTNSTGERQLAPLASTHVRGSLSVALARATAATDAARPPVAPAGQLLLCRLACGAHGAPTGPPRLQLLSFARSPRWPTGSRRTSSEEAAAPAPAVGINNWRRPCVCTRPAACLALGSPPQSIHEAQVSDRLAKPKIIYLLVSQLAHNQTLASQPTATCCSPPARCPRAHMEEARHRPPLATTSTIRSRSLSIQCLPVGASGARPKHPPDGRARANHRKVPPEPDHARCSSATAAANGHHHGQRDQVQVACSCPTWRQWLHSQLQLVRLACKLQHRNNESLSAASS